LLSSRTPFRGEGSAFVFLSLGRFGFGFSFAPAFRICKQVTRHTHFRIVEHARATTIDFHPCL
jgi:hypothetical protein